MKRLAAILLVAWCGYAQADVYKWTDEHGEVHFGESPPTPNAEKVMTQDQIQRTEQADKRIPPTADDHRIDDEVAARLAHCQLYKNLKEDYLMNVNTPYRAHYRYAFSNNAPNTAGKMGIGEIEAGLRQYCD